MSQRSAKLLKVLGIAALPELWVAAIVFGFLLGQPAVIWIGVAGLAGLFLFTTVFGLWGGVRYTRFVAGNWKSFNVGGKLFHSFFAAVVVVGLLVIAASTVALVFFYR